MSNTNARGYEDITSNVIKEISHLISLWLTHMINCIIGEKRFSKCLKNTHLLPILKLDNPKLAKQAIDQLSIINLSVVKKIIEEFIKNELTKYRESKNIILEGNHGGRAGDQL